MMPWLLMHVDMADKSEQADTTSKPASRRSERSKEPAPPPTKKLPQEEIDKSVTRMSSVKRRDKELPPIVERRALTKDQEDASVRRLYENAMQHAQRSREASEKKIHGETGAESKKLEEAELTEAVARLYNQSMQRKEMVAKKLDDKYAPPVKQSKLTKETQEAVCDRLYSQSRSKTADAKTRLYNKYVLDMLPKVPKRNNDEWKQTSDRLYRKPG